MTRKKTVVNQRFSLCNCLTGSFADQIAADAYRGLSAPQKFLPSKYFYDDRGSRLFEEICQLPEYYLTRTELAILEAEHSRIMEPFRGGDLIELGSGSCWKICQIIDACSVNEGDGIRYIPVDVSEAAIRAAGEELIEVYSRIHVLGFIADFTTHLHHIPNSARRFIILFGSTIGNFTDNVIRAVLAEVASSMHSGDRFLIGLDMVKEPEIINAAYNDSRGVTAQFNKNILRVFNRELSADFNPDSFDHLAFYSKEKEQVEMHLVARDDMTVHVHDLDLSVDIAQGETIHTEISRKFRRESVTRLFASAGLSVDRWFTDDRGWFCLANLTKA